MEQKRFVLNGNLKTKGRKRYLFRDDDGKVKGYGTQQSAVMQDSDGSWVAVPTIVDGKAPMKDWEAFARYKKTGEFFHRGKTADEADAGARAAHAESEAENQAWWNNYLADHMDDGTLSETDKGIQETIRDPGFRRWARGEAEGAYKRELRQDAKGGDAPAEVPPAEVPPSEGGPVPEGGPRIVINPTTFTNKKDALCVAFNEAFRVVMEDMQFDPVSEPTERQRRFFSNTAYADDETQLRRTILARICTFDTSVKDPTDEQLEEAVEFLEDVMEAGIPQNEWEQSSVQRIHDVIVQSVGRQPAEEAPAEEAPAEEAPAEEAPAEEAQADLMGGDAEDVDRNGDGSVIDHSKDVAESGMNADDAEATAAGAAETTKATAADDTETPVAGGQTENDEIQMLGIDFAASNDVFQFDPYSKRKEDEEQAARDKAADIIGPMALKRDDDAMKKKAPGTPGAWDGSMKQIGPQTKGAWDGSMKQIGPQTKGAWDGRFVQTGDAYRRR